MFFDEIPLRQNQPNIQPAHHLEIKNSFPTECWINSKVDCHAYSTDASSSNLHRIALRKNTFFYSIFL